jgi:cell wall-associated NlpC family hydrolase
MRNGRLNPEHAHGDTASAAFDACVPGSALLDPGYGWVGTLFRGRRALDPLRLIRATGCGLALAGALALAACSNAPPSPKDGGSRWPQGRATYATPAQQDAANEIVLQAMALLDTGYQFGGRNPEAGLDCSGMVSLVVEKATGRRLPHNAAQIAAQTRNIPASELKPGDFVFFNTSGKPYSHMGIYLGDGRFVHAPSSRGKVRLEKLDLAYFSKRFTGARTLFSE